VTGVDSIGLLHMDLWRTRFDGNKWRQFLEEGLEGDEQDRIRKATRTGRPLGSDNFIRHFEALTGKFLRPGKSGRKRVLVHQTSA
jgi:putative transposase